MVNIFKKEWKYCLVYYVGRYLRYMLSEKFKVKNVIIIYEKNLDIVIKCIYTLCIIDCICIYKDI